MEACSTAAVTAVTGGRVAALECLRRLAEERVPLTRPVRAAALSDQEGAFAAFLGSKALVHGLGA